MIERKFITENLKELQVQEFISESLKNVGHSKTKLVKTPLGEKIVIYASRPGLIVGRKGENIKKLTNVLKKRFEFENPQIEIAEVENPNLDAQIVAERIASTLERFGIQKFKAIGHKTMQEVMNAGALGIEIKMSGKIPSARAKTWRFYSGYLKKSGDIAQTSVKHANAQAQLKPGTVGIKVSIMPRDIKRPDDITITETPQQKPPVNQKQEPLQENKKNKETKE
ncbi:30S ribosomal protein S3 [Candidatus Woesearchaeota archaeon]|nr:30S ribosomal protein S3 [Candidatus Woesearchaeota archaeon]